MKYKTLLKLVGIVGFLVGTLVITFSFKQPKTDWKTRFGVENKAPFGFYILYKELKQLTAAHQVIEIKSLEELKTLNPETDVIFFINEKTNGAYQIKQEINALNKRAFLIFFAEENHANISERSANDIMIQINDFKTNTNLNEYTNTAFYVPKNRSQHTLGTVKINQKTYTNYQIVYQGKSITYNHVDPILFSNFYLLKENGYLYAKEVFKPLNGKTIYWINPSQSYFQNKDNSALSFILSQPELKIAWYILLTALGLYIVFKSKREQPYIPIVQSEKNLSLDFAHTIASMYYESGKPHDIITKKIDYFYHTIRKQFNIHTENILDPQILYVLAQKAQISTEEAREIFQELHQLYYQHQAMLKDVHRTYEIIEHYKKKAHIL